MALYYEGHVTVEPVFDDRLEHLKTLVSCYGFRVADLLMKKRDEDTEERSANDSFMTGHDKKYETLLHRMTSLVWILNERGFQVWRYKIESVVLDSRIDSSVIPLQNMPR